MEKPSARGATDVQRARHHRRADPPALDIRGDQNPAKHEFIRSVGPKPVRSDHAGTIEADLIAVWRGFKKLDVAGAFAGVEERRAIGVEQGQASRLVTGLVWAK